MSITNKIFNLNDIINKVHKHKRINENAPLPSGLLKQLRLILEKLPPAIIKKYKGYAAEVKDYYERYKDWFKGENRIYLPLDTGNLVPQEIKVALADEGYEVVDYINNKAKRIGYTGQNTTAIGKILNRMGEKELLQKFVNRFSGKKVSTEPVEEKDKRFVVISRDPIDIAMMSAERRWTSCMTVWMSRKQKAKLQAEGRLPSYVGTRKEYVEKDIKEGTLVAYVIKGDDLDIKDPLSRVLIKPFIHEKSGKRYLIHEDKPYEDYIPGFFETVEKWLLEVQGRIPKGSYKLLPSLYHDRKTTHYESDPLTYREFQSRITEPVTRDLYRKIKYSIHECWLVDRDTEYKMEKVEITKVGYKSFLSCYGVEWKAGEWNGGKWMSGTWVEGKWISGYDSFGESHPEDDSPNRWVPPISYEEFKNRVTNATEEVYSALLSRNKWILKSDTKYKMEKLEIYHRYTYDEGVVRCYDVTWESGIWDGGQWMSGTWLGGEWKSGIDPRDDYKSYAPKEWPTYISYDEFKSRVGNATQDLYDTIYRSNKYLWILDKDTEYWVGKIVIDSPYIEFYNVYWKKGSWGRSYGVWVSGTWKGGVWDGGYDINRQFRSDPPNRWYKLISYDEFNDRVDNASKELYRNIMNSRFAYWILLNTTKYEIRKLSLIPSREEFHPMIKAEGILWKIGEWRGGQWINGTWEGGRWVDGTDKDNVRHNEGDSPNKWNERMSYEEFKRRVKNASPQLYENIIKRQELWWILDAESDYSIRKLDYKRSLKEYGYFLYAQGVRWRNGIWKSTGCWISGNWLGGTWENGRDAFESQHSIEDPPSKWKNLISYAEFRRRYVGGGRKRTNLKDTYASIYKRPSCRWVIHKETKYVFMDARISSTYGNVLLDGVIWKRGKWNGGIWKYGIWMGGEWLGGYDHSEKYHGAGDTPDQWFDIINYTEFASRVKNATPEMYIKIIRDEPLLWILRNNTDYSIDELNLSWRKIKASGVVWNKGGWNSQIGEWDGGTWYWGWDEKQNYHEAGDAPDNWGDLMGFEQFKKRVDNVTKEIYENLRSSSDYYWILKKDTDYTIGTITQDPTQEYWVWRKKYIAEDVVWKKGSWKNNIKFASGKWLGGTWEGDSHLWISGKDKKGINHIEGDDPRNWVGI